METLAVWLPSIPTLLLLAGALFIPGLVWAWSFGLRGPLLVTASPLLSAALVGGSAVVAGAVGFWWGWLFLGAATVVVTLATWLLRRVGASQPAPGWGPGWLWVEVGVGVTVAAVISAWSMVRAIGTPYAPVQTWDGMFHMSAARFVFSTGDGSTLHLGMVADPDRVGMAFYPAGWHDLVALAMESGRGAVEASNMASLFVMGVIWPLGVALFVYSLFPNLRFGPFSAALLGSASTAFPERLASYGTLWPLMYAYALVPFALALAVVFFRPRPFAPSWNLLVVLILGLVGIGLVHPQGALAFVVLGLWLLLARAGGALADPRSATTSGKVFLFASVPLMVLFLVALRLTPAGRTTTGWSGRTAVGTISTEIRGLLLDSQMSSQGYGNEGGFWVFPVLLFLGVVAVFVMRSQRWLVISWLAASYLYLVASTLALPGYFLVGFWYSDPVRLGALVMVAAVPIMAIGLAWFVGLLLTRGVGGSISGGIYAASMSAILVFLYLTTGGLGRHVGSQQLWINYVYKEESGLNGLAGEEELDMIARVAEELPEGARVIGSPFTGASLVFSVSGVDSVFKIYAQPQSADLAYVADNFGNLLEDPRVCEILNARGIEYFYYDTVTYRLGDATHPWFGGLENPGAVLEELEVVDSGGTATLYRLTPCDVE